jgi:chemotaxis protein methyltransferase CheR
MFSVDIKEARHLMEVVDRIYDTGFSGWAMASFRLRLSGYLEKNRFSDIGELADRLADDPLLTESYIRDMYIGSPDLFRDPDLWIYLRDKLLPRVLEAGRYPEIIVPESVTGHELYSMAVLLNETGLDYRVDLAATCRNKKILEQINLGELSSISYKNSRDNYDVFHPDGDFEKHIITRNNKPCLNKELLEKTEIRVEPPSNLTLSDTTAIILYRNRMIYQNAEQQRMTLVRLLGKMRNGMYLITGMQESIQDYRLKRMYSTVSSDLKIYSRNNAN